MSERVSCLGEILLTAEGKKHYEEIREELTKLFYVRSHKNGTFLLHEDIRCGKEDACALLTRLAEKCYIEHGYINFYFYRTEDDQPYRLRYIPATGKWQEYVTVSITAYPKAVQHGEIVVPKGLSPDETGDYICDNWHEIRFDDPELDYCGIEFEYNDEDFENN